jgi:hypothetical protein
MSCLEQAQGSEAADPDVRSCDEDGLRHGELQGLGVGRLASVTFSY